MQAFLNDPAIKKKYLSRVRAHRKADEIIKGKYWENGKGCAVGCTIESSDHSRYEVELGIPIHIAQLEDSIFYGMSNDKAMLFPEKFLSAIKVGADLSLVPAKFFVWLLIDEKDGVLQYVKNDDSVKAIKTVADLYQRKIDGGEISKEEWMTAAADANDDAAATYVAASTTSAAYVAFAASAYASAAAYASVAASDACYFAAYASVAADYAYAARKRYYDRMAEKLLELLNAA